METLPIPGFRKVPRTGVIYVTSEAMQKGFTYDDPTWANLGQGSPETGPIPNAPERIERVTMESFSRQYAPVQGTLSLREAVAEFYNKTFRRGHRSKYTADNVSITSGGRLALTRVAAALGNVNMGHFIPDYTAYEELLSVFRAFIPIPILLDAEGGYRISPAALEKEMLGRGLSALLVSNPTNPTGQLLAGEELEAWVNLARKNRCTLIMDEFYSHFIYNGRATEPTPIVSAASYVDDVDTDPVIIVDGLTKNWRYPGWRISWTLGPRSVIETIASAGSFLDGGANHPFQEAALQLLDTEHALQETRAIQEHFGRKRAFLLEHLAELGITVDAEPEGTFYVWANLSKLPDPLNDGLAFFREGLKEKVITVPGVFFDVNPDNRRSHARYQNYTRISFGPEMEKLEIGIQALTRVVDRFS
jgi:aspartate/methionine/tyrosine aminotransferase